MRLFLPVSLLIFFVAAVTRPSSGTCPPHHQVSGINRAGVWTCRPLSTQPDPGSRVVEDKTLDARELQSAIYCSGGSEPIVVDDRTVGCMRGGWRQ